MIKKINFRQTESEEWKSIQRQNQQVFIADVNNDKDLMLDWPYRSLGVSYY